MLDKNTIPHGEAIPDTSRHAVTTVMPEWSNVEAYGSDSASVVLADWRIAYPRLKPPKDVVQLATVILQRLGLEDTACFLYNSLQSAKECITYCTSVKRDDGAGRKAIQSDNISIRCFRAKDRFFAVLGPMKSMKVMLGFWKTPGVGMSSRCAESNLACLDQLVEVDISRDQQPETGYETPVHEVLRQRIVYHLTRAPLVTTHKPPSSDDVYLFPSGMAAIYKPYSYLATLYDGTTVVFGMSFLSTIALVQEFGPSFKFFGLGTDEDLDDLEVFLKAERAQNRKVISIWTEFPSNPNVGAPDLVRLRTLADEYDVVLGVDSTIGSFANIDVLHMTDLLIASLSKSFNGNADLLAGGVILNPESRRYSELKALFSNHYVSEFHVTDAQAMETNSRDYLERTVKLNHNAHALVEYFSRCALDPKSAVSNVFYPTVNDTGKNYRRFMRPATPELTPGYGCLFSVEFEDLPTTIAFYDTLNLYKSLHLGAPWTLVFAYNLCSYKTKLDWAMQYGLKPTQLRFSAGLEDPDAVIRELEIAVGAADRVKNAGAGVDPRTGE